MPPVRFSRIADLYAPHTLRRLLPSLEKVTRTSFSNQGYSGASMDFIHVQEAGGQKHTFVLKVVDLSEDWFSQRTHDTEGREVAVLDEPALQSVWDAFACPYVAYAIEEGRLGLLMEDLSPSLFPNVREPISAKDETLIIEALARMHAHYWEAPALHTLPQLHQPADYLYIMGPLDHEAPEPGEPQEGIEYWVRTGWDAVFRQLPSDLSQFLQESPPILFARWNDLPMTLLHGDMKLANIAILPDDKVAVFDWAFVGVGPCTFDLGWYLAVNATRLAQSKEAFIAQYRQALERHLQTPLADELWTRMVQAGLFCGAMMLLWSKARSLEAGKPGAEEEWHWWVDQVASVA